MSSAASTTATAVGIRSLDIGHPAILGRDDRGMDDRVQLGDSIGKRDIRQSAPIDASVSIQYLAAKVRDDGAVGCFPGRIKLVRQRVGLEIVRTALGQHGATVDLPQATPPVRPTRSMASLASSDWQAADVA